MVDKAVILCLYCSAENLPGAKFCQNCGKPLHRVCSSCGAVNPAEARFCSQCGTLLVAPQAAQAEAATDKSSKVSALQHGTGRNEKGIKEGERRPVAILFTDIVDSTAMAERLDPENWREIVNGVHQLVSKAVQSNDGTVAQLLGDGVLAFFGAPVTHEDDPLRAVKTGLEIQEAMQGYREQVSNMVANFQMRMGINTGLVVVGSVGSETHTEYLAVGDAVNLAARLQALAQPGKVVISEAIFEATSSSLECSDLGLVKVKGKSDQVHIYQVERIKESFSSMPARTRTSSRMVGREVELQKLQELTAAVQAGIGRVSILIGEPGVGKSRLAAEWKASMLAQDPNSLYWAVGHCLSYGQDMAYHLVNDLLRSLVGLTPSTTGEQGLLALQNKVKQALGDDWRDSFILLAHLLSLPLDQNEQFQVTGLDPLTLQGRYVEALKKLLGKMTKQKPVVLLCEDLHWADPSSVEVLIRLLPLPGEVPLFLCFTTRPEQNTAGWKLVTAARAGLGTSLNEIALQTLSDRATGEMVITLLDSNTLPEGIRQLVMGKSEGNPLFVEEVVRMLIDNGTIKREGDLWKAARDLDSVEIPDTLKRLVLSRIDLLDEAPKRVLRVASVIGREFPVKVLEKVYAAGVEESRQERMVSHLSTLEYANLIRLAATFPDLRYFFYHAIIQEAAYEAMLKADRKLLHRAVAEALEGAFPDRLEELAGTLGYHFNKGEVPDKAAKYLSQAARAAQARYANQEAIGLYYQAIEMTDRVIQASPENGGWKSQAIEMREALGDVLDLVGQHKEARAVFQKALADCDPQNLVGRAKLQRMTAETWVPQHGWNEALEAYEQAENILGPEQDDRQLNWWREWVSIQVHRMNLYYWQNRVDEINRLAATVRPVVERYGTAVQKGEFYQDLVLASIRQERYRVLPQTLEDMKACLTYLNETKSLSELGFPYFLQGFIYLWHGDLGPAEEEMQKALILARKTGDITTESRCMTYLTVCARMRGEVEEVERLGQESEAVALRAGMTEYQGTAWANLVWSAWKRDDMKEAQARAQQAEEQWQKVPAGHASCSFIWTAQLPMLAMSLAEGLIDEAAGHALALLNPAVMRLPDALEQALQKGIANWKAGRETSARKSFERSMELAKEFRYL